MSENTNKVFVSAEYSRKLKDLLRKIQAYYKSDSRCDARYKCSDCKYWSECKAGAGYNDHRYEWIFEADVNALIGGNNESKD